MTAAIPRHIAVLGAGRMGEGIALSCAYAGLPLTVVDVKDRPVAERAAYLARARTHLQAQAQFMVRLGLLEAAACDTVLDRITLLHKDDAVPALATCELLFEAVPEVLETKAEHLRWVAGVIGPQAIIASTTSTFLVTELAAMVPQPGRVINAHWLNPATLMPLVEVSRSEATSAATVDGLLSLLKAIGKVPVLCNPAAGYIVPRIQALAMNEAARMVEEGVASAQDIDTAVRVGFGLRFSVLGLLEFTDWGGGDILYYASRYLAGALHPRFEPPAVIAENMRTGRTGLREGQGFYDYRAMDVEAYRLQRMGDFVQRLDMAGLRPRMDSALETGMHNPDHAQ